MILSCTDLGGFNNEGTRWKQPGWLRDCMKDKCPEQLPNCITFWRSKNWAFVVLRPWDFRGNLVPQHNLANPNTVTWLLWFPIRILQNKCNVFSTLLRSHPPLKLDILTADSLSFSLQLRNWSSEVFSSLFWATEHANRKTKIHVPQTFGVLFRNFLRTV